MVHQKDSKDSIRSQSPADFSDRIKAKSAKNKRRWGEVWGKPCMSFQESFPSGVAQVMQQVVTTWEILPTRKAHIRFGAQGFQWGLVRQTPPAQHVPEFQTPRRKAGAQQKLHGLHKLFRQSELLLPFRVVGILLKSKFLDASQGQPGLSKDKRSQACYVTSFLHTWKEKTKYLINNCPLTTKFLQPIGVLKSLKRKYSECKSVLQNIHSAHLYCVSLLGSGH